MTLLAIKYENNRLEILDQLLLPLESRYIPILSVEDGWNAIKKMQVRGAPAIAIVGCLSLAVELRPKSFESLNDFRWWVSDRLDYLVSARPTAINMRNARGDIARALDEEILTTAASVSEAKAKVINKIEKMLEEDIKDNKAIGAYGAEAILEKAKNGKASVLTHCNTGSLATAGYGTALGVVRNLQERQALDHVYCTETRPYNQGARLTAYELVYEHIPHTLICDSMAGWLMRSRGVDAVVVGADHVALNGDTANKIGTYALAVLARHHGIPFYIAAPTTSFNPNVASGEQIVIESRPEKEMTHVNGQRVAAPGANCWNPAFDVTPADLITGIITERGIYRPEQMKVAYGNGWKPVA